MPQRHAYLIMAHNDYALLREILRDLDHADNDIFLHMDAKSKDAPMEDFQSAVCHARYFPVSRMEVNWAGYSQIACELHLLQNALAQGPHMYYHLITGATCPVFSQDRLHAYFEAHAGEEFIGFTPVGDYAHRARLISIFNEIGKPKTAKQRRQAWIRDHLKGLQSRLHYVYGPARDVEFHKGIAYWSLTQQAAEYLISQKEWIYKVFRYSMCADEVFAHTLIYNSPFREKIHDLNNEQMGCLRYFKPARSWDDDFCDNSEASKAPENGITGEDIPAIISSGKLFALKFVGNTGLEAFRLLKESR